MDPESELLLGKVILSILLLYLIFHNIGSSASKKIKPEGESPWATLKNIRETIIGQYSSHFTVQHRFENFDHMWTYIKNVNNSIKYSWETEWKAFLKSMRIISSSLCSSMAILIHFNMLINVSVMTLVVL